MSGMPKLTSADRLLRTISEDAFDAQLVDLAALSGWDLTYHTYRSDRSEPGWVDRVWVRDDRLVVAELKRWNGQPSGEQYEWLAALQHVKRVEAYLWRPADFEEAKAVFR